MKELYICVIALYTSILMRELLVVFGKYDANRDINRKATCSVVNAFDAMGYSLKNNSYKKQSFAIGRYYLG